MTVAGDFDAPRGIDAVPSFPRYQNGGVPHIGHLVSVRTRDGFTVGRLVGIGPPVKPFGKVCYLDAKPIPENMVDHVKTPFVTCSGYLSLVLSFIDAPMNEIRYLGAAWGIQQ